MLHNLIADRKDNIDGMQFAFVDFPEVDLKYEVKGNIEFDKPRQVFEGYQMKPYGPNQHVLTFKSLDGNLENKCRLFLVEYKTRCLKNSHRGYVPGWANQKKGYAVPVGQNLHSKGIKVKLGKKEVLEHITNEISDSRKQKPKGYNRKKPRIKVREIGSIDLNYPNIQYLTVIRHKPYLVRLAKGHSMEKILKRYGYFVRFL